MKDKPLVNFLVLYILWIVATALGWWAGIIDLTASNARTYLEVARLIPVYLLNGIFIGMVTGVGQMLILRKTIPKPSRWFWVTLLGYTLAFPAGVLILVLIPSIAFPLQGMDFLPLTEPSTMTFYMYPQSLFWGIFIVGLVQWPVLKCCISNPSAKKRVLWVLATWLGSGMGIFTRRLFADIPIANAEQLAIGISIGVVTGLVLMILISQIQSESNPGSS